MPWVYPQSPPCVPWLLVLLLAWGTCKLRAKGLLWMSQEQASALDRSLAVPVAGQVVHWGLRANSQLGNWWFVFLCRGPCAVAEEEGPGWRRGGQGGETPGGSGRKEWSAGGQRRRWGRVWQRS